ncbi:hypothetical protein ACFQ4C_03260 [Larkinella insperata]|uniref:Uncharacterized protein n=1 Tax=Larkinella insperata TaxID=332158 RepID=A0ABW3QJP6_9BACT|nr:hypothetical protein [Larkinella insperata]
MKTNDRRLAAFFGVLTLILVLVTLTNEDFLHWVFERHQNQLSWYLRPLFLIPFCFFAYQRRWAGLTGTVFILLTSTFWFPKPRVVDESVRQFLQFEQEWLRGPWDLGKICLSLLVPVSMAALGMAFWKKSVLLGLAVLFSIAVGKICWSILQAGQAGAATVVPALLGLLICCLLTYFGVKHLERQTR